MKTFPISIAVALAAIVLVRALPFAQSSGRNVRVIAYGIEQPISARLLATDETVVIDRLMEGAVPGDRATASDVLRGLAVSADRIAVVEGYSLEPVLVDDGTWINTRVTTLVEETLKDNSKALFPGARVEMEFSGGEMVITGVLVRAWESPNIQPRKRYLAFLKGERTPIHSLLRIEGGRLASISAIDPRTKSSDPLNDLSIDSVTSEIRVLLGSK